MNRAQLERMVAAAVTDAIAPLAAEAAQLGARIAKINTEIEAQAERLTAQAARRHRSTLTPLLELVAGGVALN